MEMTQRKINVILYQGIKLLVEVFNSTNIYPSNKIFYDDNLVSILPKSKLDKLPAGYIDAYIYGILGRGGDLVESGIKINKLFNSEIPKYDLSAYDLGQTNLTFEGYALVQDTELIESKNKLISEIKDCESEDEIINLVKDKFNLVSKEPEEVSSDGVDPSSIRPTDLVGITKLFGPYLIDKSNIVGDHIEFEIDNPISDFCIDWNGTFDPTKVTQLMSEILSHYNKWIKIECEKVESNSIKYEVYPISDNTLYLKVGSSYVKTTPADLQVGSNGSYFHAFKSGPTLPRIVLINGSDTLDLNPNNLRLLDTDGSLKTLTTTRYRSIASGAVSDEVYVKVDSEYKSVTGLSKSLAMFTQEVTKSDKTKFYFYFK